MRPLEDVRIIAVEQYGAGPFGSVHLADLGARGDQDRGPAGRRRRRSLRAAVRRGRGLAVLRDVQPQQAQPVARPRDAARAARSSRTWSQRPTSSTPTCAATCRRRCGIRYDDLKHLNPRDRLLLADRLRDDRAAPRGAGLRLRPAGPRRLDGADRRAGRPADQVGSVAWSTTRGGFVAAISLLAGRARRPPRRRRHGLRRQPLRHRDRDADLPGDLAPQRGLHAGAHAPLRAPVAGAVPGVRGQGRLAGRRLRQGEVLAAAVRGGRSPGVGRADLAVRHVRRARRAPAPSCCRGWRRSSGSSTVDEWLDPLYAAVDPVRRRSTTSARRWPRTHTAARDLVVDTEHPRYGTVRQVASPVRVGDERARVPPGAAAQRGLRPGDPRHPRATTTTRSTPCGPAARSAPSAARGAPTAPARRPPPDDRGRAGGVGHRARGRARGRCAPPRRATCSTALGTAIARPALRHGRRRGRRWRGGLGGPPEATLLGTAERIGAPAAALATGTLVHALDFDDTHAGGLVHATAVVLPAAFAVGEQVGATGREVLDAAVVGYETVCRVAAAAPHGFHARGLHATMVAGVFSSALVAARLLGLDAARTVRRARHRRQPGRRAARVPATGASTKQLHPGLRVARRASSPPGSPPPAPTGPATVFDGPDGLYDALADRAGRPRLDRRRARPALGDHPDRHQALPGLPALARRAGRGPRRAAPGRRSAPRTSRRSRSTCTRTRRRSSAPDSATWPGPPRRTPPSSPCRGASPRWSSTAT